MTDPELLLLDEPALVWIWLAANPWSPRSASSPKINTHLPRSSSLTMSKRFPTASPMRCCLKAGSIVAAGPLRDTLTAENLTKTFEIELSLVEADGRWTARAL
jgi:iron complex transport system ATP-binding protein